MITESEIYAELVAAYRRPPAVQEGDITVEQFAADTGMSVEGARVALDLEVKRGRLAREKRTGKTGRMVSVYLVKRET